MKKLLSFIGKIIYRRTEFVYVYEMPNNASHDYGSLTLEEVKKLAAKNESYKDRLEQLKMQVIQYVKKDLGSTKEIKFSDFVTDYSNGVTYYVFASDKGNPFFVPLFYEIYAYTKLKDSSKFTYKSKLLVFNQIKILKFKVKCYGKKS